MARVILLAILILVAARFIWRLIEAVIRGAMGQPQAGASRGGQPFDAAQGRPPTAVKMQPCPVCGTYVVPGRAISAASGGTTLYFCSDRCRADYQSR